MTRFGAIIQLVNGLSSDKIHAKGIVRDTVFVSGRPPGPFPKPLPSLRRVPFSGYVRPIPSMALRWFPSLLRRPFSVVFLEGRKACLLATEGKRDHPQRLNCHAPGKARKSSLVCPMSEGPEFRFTRLGRGKVLPSCPWVIRPSCPVKRRNAGQIGSLPVDCP